MKLINNSDNALSHALDADHFYRVEVGQIIDVPEKVAKIWLKFDGVSAYASPEDVEKEKEKAVKEALAKAKAEQKATKNTKSKNTKTK